MVTVDITSHDRDKNKTILLLLFGSVFIQLASAGMCNSYECEKLNEGYDMRVALKHHAKNDINGSIKVLRHCLRQMCLALQIYNHLCILDYSY